MKHIDIFYKWLDKVYNVGSVHRNKIINWWRLTEDVKSKLRALIVDHINLLLSIYNEHKSEGKKDQVKKFWGTVEPKLQLAIIENIEPQYNEVQ